MSGGGAAAAGMSAPRSSKSTAQRGKVRPNENGRGGPRERDADREMLQKLLRPIESGPLKISPPRRLSVCPLFVTPENTFYCRYLLNSPRPNLSCACQPLYPRIVHQNNVIMETNTWY